MDRIAWPAWVEKTALTYWSLKASGQRHQDAAYWTQRTHPGLLGHLKPSTIIRAMKRHRKAMVGLGKADRNWKIPPPIYDEIEALLHLGVWKKAMCWFDLHAPKHNPRLIEAGCRHAAQEGITRLFLGGDTFDLFFASGFVGYGKSTPLSTREDIRRCRMLFDSILEVFDEVVLFGGNHDEGRWKKVFGGRIGFLECLEMILRERVDRMTITSRRWMLADSPAGVWRLTHQAGRGRKVPASMVQEKANLEQQHVIMGHEHYLGQIIEKSGQFWGVNGGFMGLEQAMDYKAEKDTCFSKWAPGYVVLDETGEPDCWRDRRAYLKYGEAEK